ncbi:TnpV protein [Faecalibacterium sp. An58]|uniref:TnpV protein n=1 Tax=Faecalibacterium sp. An58 TaxID=1965648 RepID=UPI000B3A089A|nr:TnpV protein [Faecalibacterium sp. An58]OUN71212.1 TnpV protein [Faecalibacterium sp. An58]
MKELRQTIQEHGIRYQLEGDYYLPVLELPEENRLIGRWGRLHKAYLKNHRPVLYQSLLLSGKLYTVLADLNEQATERCSCIIRQMAEAEGITEELKANDPMCWVQAMNSIRSRAEEIIQVEIIYC